MASISLLLLGFLAVLIGLIYFYGKTKKITGSVVVIVISLVGLYIAVTFSDVVLSRFGFVTGFPSAETGYYLYQSFIYLFLGFAMLGTHYYLLKETQSKEVSYAFWWDGVVLLITGALDLLIETFTRIPMMEFRLFLAMILLAILVVLATKYRERLFGKKEETGKAGAQTMAKPEARK